MFLLVKFINSVAQQQKKNLHPVQHSPSPIIQGRLQKAFSTCWVVFNFFLCFWTSFGRIKLPPAGRVDRYNQWNVRKFAAYPASPQGMVPHFPPPLSFNHKNLSNQIFRPWVKVFQKLFNLFSYVILQNWKHRC